MSTKNATDTKPYDDTHRVVVIGSGYAGIHAVCELVKRAKSNDNLEIVLLSNTDHLLYVTMIYEVVAGNLAPSSVRQSVRTMIEEDQIHFLQGIVDQADFDNQTINYLPKDSSVSGSNQDKEITISYDYLISSIGSETDFHNTPGAAENAYTLKTLADAQTLKNKLINHFEAASMESDIHQQQELLHFVVVGGGPTGVTLAAKIADLFNHEMATAFPELIGSALITILEGSDRLLTGLDSWFAERAYAALKKKQYVNVVTNRYVTNVQSDGVSVDDAFISSKCVIWVAGVQAREFRITAQKSVLLHEQTRRIYVTEALHTENYPNVFVAGDQCWVDRGVEGTYPMRAQFAVRQGKQAAANVIHSIRSQPLKDFYWKDKGLVVSLGKGHTYAQVGSLKFSGLLATMAYKSIYLMSTIGVRAKLRAMLEWGMNIFLPRDVSEL
ncbi:MAG: FAD-dependent oxidoreductase [Candidatus Paceibacterota bacterium]